MALNLSAYDPLLKEAYEGVARETLNNEVPLFKILDESDKQWSGRRVIFPFHSARNSGVGARAEGGTLPSAGQQGTLQGVVSAVYNYASIQLTGQVMNAGKNVFADALAYEMENAVKDLTVDLSRQTWGTGDGRLAQVGAAASATAVTLYNRFFEPGQPGARFISQGQYLDFGTVASPTALGTAVRAQAVSISSNPATTVDSLNVSGSYAGVSQCETFVFNQGAGGAGVEMLGVQALVDVYSEANVWGSNAFYGATIQGIARSTNAAFDSIVLGNSGTARIIDGTLMQTAFDSINQASGEEPTMIMGHHLVVREFLDAVSADRRYSTPVFDAGMSKLSYNGVSLERDRHAPYNSLLVFKREALKMFTLLDLEWAQDDGAILSRVSGQDSYVGYLRIYRNLGFDMNPKLCCMIRDIRTD